MSRSYKKNTKDKNYKVKLNIKTKLNDFDEKLVFENEEELNEKIDLFLSEIEKSYVKKYLILYITEKLKQKLKLERKLVRLRNSKNTSKKLAVKEELKNISEIIKILNKKLELLNTNNRKINYKNKECDEKQQNEDNTQLNNEDDNILTKLEKKNINIMDYKDDYEEYFKAFILYLKKNTLEFNYISDSIEFLYILEKENKITKEDIETYLYSIIDVINIKINNIPKENKELREKFKIIKNKLEIILEFYKTDTSKKKHDYFYDILEILLESPKNYYIIEKLLQDMNDFVNASKRIRIKKGYNNKESETYRMQHILITIVDRYIENYKLELRGQTIDFIDKNYYKKLYYLFIKNPYLEIDKSVIHKMLNDFLLILDNSNYLRNNKDKITKEIGSMLREEEEKEEPKITNNILDHIRYLEPKVKSAMGGKRVRMDKEYLNNISELYQRIVSQIDNPAKEKLKQAQRTIGISNRDRRNILLGCETISFFNDHSYSISYYDDGSYSFRFNVIDLYDIIKDSPIEDYLLDCLDKQDKNILLNNRELYFEVGKAVPSITYEIRVYQNGCTGPLKIYKSVVEVEKQYDSIDSYKEDGNLKNLIIIYKILSLDSKPNLDLTIVDDYFKEMFSNLIMQYSKENGIPTIVKGKEDYDEQYYIKLHYELCEIYSKLDRKVFERIYNILRMNLTQKHYIKSDYENGCYKVPLDNDYIKYFNQKIISEFIIKRELDESYIAESEDVLEKANYGISYIGDKKTIDKNKGKVYHN